MYDASEAWFLRFDDSAKIVEVRQYLDSSLLTRAFAENDPHGAINEGTTEQSDSMQS